MNHVLNLILSHQPAAAVAKMIGHWGGRCVPTESILIAYGGPRAGFESIEHEQKFFVDDLRLRTRDHQREFQSYTEIFKRAATFLTEQGAQYQFIHFAEYDHIPLIQDLNNRQIERLAAEGADLLGFHVNRVDGTSNPHFLYHISNPAFRSYWLKITVRSDPDVVLSMFGTGSFWTRETFLSVVDFAEPFPMYMEIYLPTLTHHLGFRVRDFTDQNQFVRALEHEICSIDQARAKGAWTLHPVKKLNL